MASRGYKSRARPGLFMLDLWAWSSTTEPYAGRLEEYRSHIGQGVEPGRMEAAENRWARGLIQATGMTRGYTRTDGDLGVGEGEAT